MRFKLVEDTNSIISKILVDVRNEFVDKFGEDNLYGKCIAASDKIVELLNNHGIASHTVEGWVLYDDDSGCSDRPYDEHTWVETSDGRILDVTATQFNSFMDIPFSPIINQNKLPHNYYYDEPIFALDDYWIF